MPNILCNVIWSVDMQWQCSNFQKSKSSVFWKPDWTTFESFQEFDILQTSLAVPLLPYKKCYRCNAKSNLSHSHLYMLLVFSLLGYFYACQLWLVAFKLFQWVQASTLVSQVENISLIKHNFQVMKIFLFSVCKNILESWSQRILYVDIFALMIYFQNHFLILNALMPLES